MAVGGALVLIAHEGHESAGGQGVELAWFADPAASVLLVASGILYVLGWSRAASAGRTRVSEPVFFGVGWSLIGLALVSPIHSAAETVLSLHMLQHTLLIIGAAAIVAGRAGTRIVQGIPPGARGRLVGKLHGLRPPGNTLWVTTSVMIATIVIWHVPPIFEAAVRIPLLHATEHVSLLVVSMAYWSHVVGPRAAVAQTGASLASLFALAVIGSGIGALLTFSSVPWYPSIAGPSSQSGIDWLVDQQLSGVAMTIPMGLTFMALAARLGWRWSGSSGWADFSSGTAPGYAEAKTSTATNPNNRAR